MAFNRRRANQIQTELIDPANIVVALCVAGMAAEGTPDIAARLFERAWAARSDEYEAAIAAHFVARHQATADASLHWNTLAIRHALAVADRRVAGFMASLYLNLGDALANVGQSATAGETASSAAEHLGSIPAGGYRDLVTGGIRRLAARVGVDRDIELIINTES